ncbi:MAG: bifunctional aldolase/short-chain dehydrogenase [Gammaproteobacteria bacterium]|nr:bifunctional aldolase/short-chain dehydrogenase [Gammaproteobacteria bacterium]
MNSLWTSEEAEQCKDELDLRVYSSRLLGRDKTLVLHGGGNTSVKIDEQNILGETETILYVKGSGWDLEFIERPGFSPVRLNHLVRLAELETLSDSQMVNELKTHMTNASAPTPSVEAILHAILPYKYVDHTHADSLVTITNTPNGLNRIKDIYGDKVVILPYCMPGFDLARLCATEFPKQVNDNTIGMVLMNHGIFSFGETAKESYERMISLVSMAESYIKQNKAWTILSSNKEVDDGKSHVQKISELRSDISKHAKKPMLVSFNSGLKNLDFVNREDLGDISQEGPATPDHVIRTKRLPMLGMDVDAYVQEYTKYFKAHESSAKQALSMLDPTPRVILDHELGVGTVGATAKETAIIADIYDHTIDVITRATRLGEYRALPAKDIFDVEYWELEQAKLKKSGASPEFMGEVVLITGAASGIGLACVNSFLARGAAVIGLDINDAVESLEQQPAYLGISCDVSIRQHVELALEKAVRHFGGIDMLILNAGIFPKSQNIYALSDESWREVMQINLDSNLMLMREAYPLLKIAPNGGRVVMMGSKNVLAPGPGAAAYSVAKAGINQLARVAALEWGQDNIRVNTLHPDAVFDTGIWTDEVLNSRAESYGLSVDEYKRKNILKTEVSSHDVAELVAEMCGKLFAKTTGAQLPVDGGNDRVI